MTDLSPDDLKKLLQLGAAATYTQYATLLKRIKEGDVLTIPEQKLFDHLHKQLAEQQTASGRSFTTRREIANYLTEKGYKVKKSTVDNHIKAGKLRPGKNGAYSLEDVERYAAAELPRLDGSNPTNSEFEEAQRRKIDLELRREQAETELAELKLKSRTQDLITGPLEQELASRLIILRSDIENFIHSRSSALIASVGGEQSRAAEFIALFLAAASTWLARYARGREFFINAEGSVSPAFDDSRINSRTDGPTEEDDMDEFTEEGIDNLTEALR